MKERIKTEKITCKECVFKGNTRSNPCYRPHELKCFDKDSGQHYIFKEMK